MRKFIISLLCMALLSSSATATISCSGKVGIGFTAAGAIGLASSVPLFLYYQSPEFMVPVGCGRYTVSGRCCDLLNTSAVDYSHCTTPNNFDPRNCPNTTSAQCETAPNHFVPPWNDYTRTASKLQAFFFMGTVFSSMATAMGLGLVGLEICSQVRMRRGLAAAPSAEIPMADVPVSSHDFH
jgi:hypothetical protein